MLKNRTQERWRRPMWHGGGIDWMLTVLVGVLLNVLLASCSAQEEHISSGKANGLENDRTYLVVVTDPHGFFSGHRHNEKFTADYASLSSFADKLREKSKTLANCEVFFFENGDMVDGGGLTDEKDGKSLTFPILDDVGFDARTFGNHELYVGKTIQSLQLPGLFVTSNIVDAKTKKPFGARYRVLPSKVKGGGNVLVFGFLYNMVGYDSSVAHVESVESSVKSEWFAQALQETKNVRFVVVLAHMDYKDALVKVILAAIRKLTKSDTLPVVFITGHTHIRRSTFLDPYAFSFETGRYMDTVGLLSFPTFPHDKKDKLLDLKHDYLDANDEVLFHFLGDDEDLDSETDKAKSLRKRLRTVRDKLELDRVVGYAAFTYSIEVGIDNPFSLARYWINRVIPKALLNRGTRCDGFFLGGSGTLRYDLLRGPVVVDDLWALNPFQEGFQVVRCVPGSIIQETISKLPTKLLGEGEGEVFHLRRPFHPSLPLFVHSDLKRVSSRKTYDLVFGMYESPMVMKYLNENSRKIRFDVEAFRQEDGLSSHSIWMDYFSAGKKNTEMDDELEEDEMVTVQRLGGHNSGDVAVTQ